jgi:hypothetical protein
MHWQKNEVFVGLDRKFPMWRSRPSGSVNKVTAGRLDTIQFSKGMAAQLVLLNDEQRNVACSRPTITRWRKTVASAG